MLISCFRIINSDSDYRIEGIGNTLNKSPLAKLACEQGPFFLYGKGNTKLMRLTTFVYIWQ